jgi:transcriptional regulator NrdR family protein
MDVMKKEELIEKLNKSKAADALYKMAEKPSEVSENEIETAVSDLTDESLKMEENK